LVVVGGAGTRARIRLGVKASGLGYDACGMIDATTFRSRFSSQRVGD
jgi:hypothetical protein